MCDAPYPPSPIKTPSPASPSTARAAHLIAGAAAEEAACVFLQAQGLQIVARNLRVKGGEIDIIARQGPMLVFVEVRWRAQQTFGGAAASIGWRKQLRLRHAIACYLQEQRELPPCRLDALCLNGQQPGGWQWIQNI